MIVRFLVICLISGFVSPALAAEQGNFMPIGQAPQASLVKESSVYTRPLPALSFYDSITPTPTTNPDTFNIESSLIYDDTPVNEVYLDKNISKPSLILPSNMFNSPIKVNQDSNAITGRSVFMQNVCIGEASRSVSGVKGYAVEKTGGFTFGAGYNRELDKAQMEDSASLFTRYDAGRFVLNSQYSATSKQDLGTQYNSFKISPEVKLSDQIRVRTGFQSYTNIPLKKGEVVLVYSPSIKKYLDSLNFEFGVAQKYNTSTGITGSEIKFSTGFRL